MHTTVNSIIECIQRLSVPQIQLQTHAVQVLLHPNELPQRLAIRDEAHNVADLVPANALPHQISLHLVRHSFVLLRNLLLFAPLLGLFSLLLLRHYFESYLLAYLFPALLRGLALEALAFDSSHVPGGQHFAAFLPFTQLVV